MLLLLAIVVGLIPEVYTNMTTKLSLRGLVPHLDVLSDIDQRLERRRQTEAQRVVSQVTHRFHLAEVRERGHGLAKYARALWRIHNPSIDGLQQLLKLSHACQFLSTIDHLFVLRQQSR
jgi:hypothetical protein